MVMEMARTLSFTGFKQQVFDIINAFASSKHRPFVDTYPLLISLITIRNV
jgi:hypothetical protein